MKRLAATLILILVFANICSSSVAEIADKELIKELEKTVRMVCAENLSGDNYTTLMTYNVFNVQEYAMRVDVYINVYGISFEPGKDYYISEESNPYCFIFIKENGVYKLNRIRFPGDSSNSENAELSYEEEIDKHYMGNYDSYPSRSKIIFEYLTNVYLKRSEPVIARPIIIQQNKSYNEYPAIIENEIKSPLWQTAVYSHATNTVCFYTKSDNKYHVTFTYVNGEPISEAFFVINNTDKKVFYVEGVRKDDILESTRRFEDP